MSLTRTSDQLKLECLQRGVVLEPAKKYSRNQMVELLGQKTISLLPPDKVTWALKERIKIESPMLCFAFWHLKQEEKDSIMESLRWICEEKWDGARMLIFYHPDEGFSFYSRNISVEDFLPVDYTDQVLLFKDGKETKARDWAKVFKNSFILDAEIVCENKNIDTSLFSKKGVVTGTELNAVTAILALNQTDSHQLQRTQAQLKFKVFDFYQYDGRPVWQQKLETRKVMLKAVMDKLSVVLPFEESLYVTGLEKEDFYWKQVQAGNEGIVLKNLDMPYINRDSRPRTTQIKRKRSVGESLGRDIDAFVSGFVPSNPDKGWKDYIGALEFSVILRMEDGTEKDHVIASCSAMPLEMRKKMTIKGADGKPSLDPQYLGKVMVVNGQDLSAKAARFMHATNDWAIGFRQDKTRLDCVLEHEFLKTMVL